MTLSRPLNEDLFLSAFPFYASLLYQAIDGVMSLAWCQQVVYVSSSSTLQIFRDASHDVPVMVALPDSLSALSFPLTPACPGQYTHRILRRWGMSNIDTCQSGLPQKGDVGLLPGADTTYIKISEGQSPWPPLDCPIPTAQNVAIFSDTGLIKIPRESASGVTEWLNW